MSKGLPVIIQNIVYRKNREDFEVLLLKRSPDRGGFWNVVNGTFEFNETIPQCRERELFEEAGIENTLRWSDELNRFSFMYQNDYIIVVLVYAAEVPPDQEVTINEEHTEYKWVSFDEAIKMMKFEDDKRGLQICRDRLISHEM